MLELIDFFITFSSMKKKVLFYLFLIALMPCILFAAEESADWWVGKAITEIKYEGLQNVTERTVNSLLSKYVNKEFTDEVAKEIDQVLYSQPWMDYYLLTAQKSEADNYSLVLNFEIVEVPQIKAIAFEGNTNLKERTLSSQLTFSKGDYYTSQLIEANKKTLLDFYKNKGYNDVSIEYVIEENDELKTSNVTYKITEGEVYKVGAIVFIGNEKLDTKTLTKTLTLKKRSFFTAGNFVQATFDSDAQQLLKYYQTQGYNDVVINKHYFEDMESDDAKYKMIKLVFDITEGQQWLVGNITFEGNTVFSNEEIQGKIYLKDGDINNVEELQNQIQAIGSLYVDNGYIATNLNVENVKHADTNKMDYNFVIVESEQSHVEKIIINGLSKTKPYVIERELMLKVGDIYSQSALQKSAQNIYNTGLISKIDNPSIYQGEEKNGVVIELTVEESNQIELQFGATFGGTVDGFPVSGFLQWSDKNLGGTGRDFSINTTLSPDTQSISLGLSDGWVKNKRWSNGISLSFERSQKSNTLQRGDTSPYFDGRDDSGLAYPKGYSSHESWIASGNMVPGTEYLMSYTFYSLSVGYNTGYTFIFDPGSLSISGGLSIGLNHAVYDDNKYDPYELLIKKYHDGWQFSNKFNLSLTWDGRDLKENTSSGYLISTNYTYAGGVLGGLSNYNRLSLSAAGYLKLFGFSNDKGEQKNVVASLTTTSSFMLPQFWNNTDKSGWASYDASQGATKYEMLYLDGMNIGRGFSIVLDQSFLWHNQLEVSFPLVNNMILMEAFMSASGVTSKLEDLDKFSNINWYFAAGFGIKLKVPGFPLGLYLVKNATLIDNTFKWVGGSLFGDGVTSGMKLVLALTTSIY